MTIITCRIPPGIKTKDLDPFPSSAKARKLGCICPEQRLWPEQLKFSSDCPVHELEKIEKVEKV